jgi:hypothetical protein
MMRVLVAACLAAASLSASYAYNPKDGLALARLEQAVYCGEERFNKWDVGVQAYTVDTSKVRFIKDAKTQSAAGVGSMTDPNGCFVAFQGTKGTVSSIIDVDFFTKKWDRGSCQDCWIHSGWAYSYESIRTDIFGALEQFDCQHKPLYVTGHSLGSAVAHYFIYDAIEADYTIKHLMAMESPRPGDTSFASALQAKVQTAAVDAYRITHYQDIVVHVPPYGLANYIHALPEIYYKSRSGTDYEVCGMDDDTWNCANQWPLINLTADDHCWYADINPCSCNHASAKQTNVTLVV